MSGPLGWVLAAGIPVGVLGLAGLALFAPRIAEWAHRGQEWGHGQPDVPTPTDLPVAPPDGGRLRLRNPEQTGDPS